MFCRQAKEMAINRLEAIGRVREMKLQDKHKSCQMLIPYVNKL